MLKHQQKTYSIFHKRAGDMTEGRNIFLLKHQQKK